MEPGAASWPVRWSNPWYQDWRGIGQAVERERHAGSPLWQALNQIGAAPVRFVAHADLPPAMAYEQFIAQTGCCPVRDGLHDLFNGLCWINFPRSKRRLNRLQATQIARHGIRPVRGALRDAVTLLDENAALMRAPQALWDALADKRWHDLFIRLRPLWRDARLVLFGHALLEKLQAPRKSITAHVLRVEPQTDSIADFDAALVASLRHGSLVAKAFAHLPVLGVPGWWAANMDPVFYDDPAVFRQPRPVAG